MDGFYGFCVCLVERLIERIVKRAVVNVPFLVHRRACGFAEHERSRLHLVAVVGEFELVVCNGNFPAVVLAPYALGSAEVGEQGLHAFGKHARVALPCRHGFYSVVACVAGKGCR